MEELAEPEIQDIVSDSVKLYRTVMSHCEGIAGNTTTLEESKTPPSASPAAPLWKKHEKNNKKRKKHMSR